MEMGLGVPVETVKGDSRFANIVEKQGL